jgi:limonene-1,2-epoxide hydrolase
VDQKYHDLPVRRIVDHDTRWLTTDVPTVKGDKQNDSQLNASSTGSITNKAGGGGGSRSLLHTSSRDATDRPFPKFTVSSPKGGAGGGVNRGVTTVAVVKGQKQRSQSTGKIRIPTAAAQATAVLGNRGKQPSQQRQHSSRIVSVMR